jgi:hypothetical protein
MPGHFFELAVSARRQLGQRTGNRLTRFSFRLALMIDLAYVGIGALGGAAVGRAATPVAPSAACAAASVPLPLGTIR